MQKGFVPLVFILIIGVLSVGIVGGSLVYRNKYLKTSNVNDRSNSSVNTSTASSPWPNLNNIVDWKIYPGEIFIFRYPSDWELKENYNEGYREIYNPKTIISTEKNGYVTASEMLDFFVSVDMRTTDGSPAVDPVGLHLSFIDYSDRKKIKLGEEFGEIFYEKGIEGEEGGWSVIFAKENNFVRFGPFKKEPLESSVEYKILSTFGFLDGKEETADWKNFKHPKFSFKYPSNLHIKETDKDFFVLLTEENGYPSNSNFLVDARLKDENSSYDSAVKKAREGLANVRNVALKNGIKISGELAGPAYQGTKVTAVVIKYKNGAILIESAGYVIDDFLFDKILATFQVLE